MPSRRVYVSRTREEGAGVATPGDVSFEEEGSGRRSDDAPRQGQGPVLRSYSPRDLDDRGGIYGMYDASEEEEEGEGAWCVAAHWKDGEGPMGKRRQCRDTFCIILFVLAWIAWLILIWVAVTDGCPEDCNDPRRLVFGTDSRTAEVCGAGALLEKPRLYYPNPADLSSRRFCVAECPGASSLSADTSVAFGLVEGDAQFLLRDASAIISAIMAMI
ncbi:hypothetical protein T484DRAFT_1837273 [Baffinella frigidus]|nr:hypothetical protein T484DRAFT_1837273 [Cryptophyta sp. CCMP2293]